MQVNNNVQSPNFGMALKISKGGKEYLAKQSEDVLNNLGKIGEEMKDYKHWDLFVTGEGFKAVEKGTSLPNIYGSVSIDPVIYRYFDGRVRFNAFVAGKYANKGEVLSLDFCDLDPEEVKSVKSAFETIRYEERFATFVRFLEKRSAEKAAAKVDEEAKAQRMKGLVDDLASKYSLDVEV